MAGPEFFQQRPAVVPTIYAYTLSGVASHEGYIKVGYTDREDANVRIAASRGRGYMLEVGT